MDKETFDLEKKEKVKLYYDSALRELDTKLKIINLDFNTLYGVNPINHIKIRMKSLASITSNLKRKGLDVNI